MKNFTILALLVAGLFMVTPEVSGQIKVDLKKKITGETNRRANKKTDQTINKGFDKMEEGVKGLLKKKDSKTEGEEAEKEAEATGNAEAEPANATPVQGNTKTENKTVAPTLSWAKYDFVPGDKIIFEDNHFAEENGEFPSRWDLVNGTIENAEFGGEKMIMFRGGSPMIVPYLKNPAIDYLPDVFTIEFDLYVNNGNSFQVRFWDTKNQSVSSKYKTLDIWDRGMQLSPARSDIPGKATIKNQWAHIAIAFTNGKMKAYINETRLINIPHLEFDPMGISLYAYHGSDHNQFFIKNFRLAEGGVKYYDRFLQDGKIVSNGIRFDVGKATLRPESMGVLNEIYNMLTEHPDVGVSIEGHTDSDGDYDLNQKLSEERAKEVMDQLVSMGINSGRITYTGYGESKPVATNDTPEGKASNRRVEFVRRSASGNQNGGTSQISQKSLNHKPSGKILEYEAITIGSQVWMLKNLDVDAFKNGDAIPQVTTEEEWQNMRYEKKAAWCYFGFEASGSEKLYNYFAVIDPRGLAPEGWRIPADEDWDILRKKLVVGIAGGKMKSQSGWKGANGTNSSGFNGKPTGFCDYNGSFENPGVEGYWWSATDDGTQWSSSVYLSAEDEYMHKHHMSKGSGLSVRCVK